MNLLPRASMVGLSLVTTLGVAACADLSPGDADAQQAGPASGDADQDGEELAAGNVQFVDCTPKQRTYLERALHVGRSAMGSAAFQKCVANGMTNRTELPWTSILPAKISIGPYTPGIVYPKTSDAPMRSDPPAASVGAQTWMVSLATTSLSNPLRITCDKSCKSADCAGAASPNLTAVGPGETMRLVMGNVPDRDWNYASDEVSNLTGLIWHEIMHNRGYQHGGTGSEADRNVPWMVQLCMEYATSMSAYYCGGATHDINRDCLGGVKMISDYGVTDSCACRVDPGILVKKKKPVIFVP